MRRVITVFLLITVGLFSESIGYLLSINNSIGEFNSDEHIGIGVTGVVERSLDGGRYKYIVSLATVIDENRVEFSKLSMLNQPSLSKGLWKPEAGDKIIFKSLYDRAMIIAPNIENYQTIRKSADLQWVHPDIFSATLNSFGQVRPLREDFNYICQNHLIGLIYLNVDNRVEVKDCFSGKTIKKLNLELSTDSKVQKPFYSRIEELSGDMFGKGTDEFQEYNSYYRELF